MNFKPYLHTNRKRTKVLEPMKKKNPPSNNPTLYQFQHPHSSPIADRLYTRGPRGIRITKNHRTHLNYKVKLYSKDFAIYESCPYWLPVLPERHGTPSTLTAT